ncbi:hypothetical protein HUB98_06150 [Paenibacillus barcinonensis]|uniref:Uncharacterized protein n=1 Tax=Paenibacillus barcinonensis TaxID=198119 RepID=A0A2V4W0F0_PAEBA|nr:hypothetical protein [Paenibacillus barcinonensis]PYE51595.1 hypothetical protein DFQ00_102390 [Paenibacillus barcinonensis]QKS55962.1 hypothetical protein HUB98_06150 [Paenibacillus barcinonensis]
MVKKKNILGIILILGCITLISSSLYSEYKINKLENSFENELDAYVNLNLTPAINYFEEYRLEGDYLNTFILTLNKDFDVLSLKEKWDFLKPLMNDYDSQRERLLNVHNLWEGSLKLGISNQSDIIVKTSNGEYEYSSVDSLREPTGKLHLSSDFEEPINNFAKVVEQGFRSPPPPGNQIGHGMSQIEVQRLLGDPDSINRKMAGDIIIDHWYYGGTYILFQDGIVKQMSTHHIYK